MIKTEFGTANLDSGGYYRVTSTKEGNYGKLVHRLIYEDNYGPIPNGYPIHHIDFDKTNNNIENLQLLTKSQHHSLHTSGKNNPMYGKCYSIEECEKISKYNNTSGYFRVHKDKNPRLKQGFAYVYRWYEKGKHKKLASVSIEKLENKVKDRGLPWIKFE